MKKTMLAFFLGLLFLVLLGAAPAWAVDVASETEEYLSDSRWDEVTDVIPNSSKDLLQQNEVSGIGDASSLTVSGLVGSIWNNIKDSFHRPMQILCSLTGIILICVLMKSIGTSLTQSNTHHVFLVIVSVFIVTILIDPIIECVLEINTVINEFSLFLATYIPVFAGVVTTAGQPMTAAAYNVLIFGACQVVGQLLKSFFVPLISCYLALAIVSEVCPQMGLRQLVGGIKTFMNWALGLSITIFLGLLTIQSVVASGGDTVTTKTTKFFISSVIPGVGNTLSDLFMATQGCMQLLKSTLGVFGIVIALFTFLPSLIKVALWYITVQIGSLVSGILGSTEISQLLKSISSALGIILAIILYYSMLFIISTSLMIVAFRGG